MKNFKKSYPFLIISLLSSVSGRAILNEHIIHHDHPFYNYVEIHKNFNPQVKPLIQENFNQNNSTYIFPENLESLKKDFDTEREGWEHIENFKEIPEWHKIQIRRFQAYAKADPQNKDVYAKEENDARNEYFKCKEIEWNDKKQNHPSDSSDWYKIEEERLKTYIEFYPESKFTYQKQHHDIVTNIIKSLENECIKKQIGLTDSYPDWHNAEAWKFFEILKYKDYFPKERAEEYQQKLDHARETRDALKKEEEKIQEWRLQHVFIPSDSHEYYASEVEIFTELVNSPSTKGNYQTNLRNALNTFKSRLEKEWNDLLDKLLNEPDEINPEVYETLEKVSKDFATYAESYLKVSDLYMQKSNEAKTIINNLKLWENRYSGIGRDTSERDAINIEKYYNYITLHPRKRNDYMREINKLLHTNLIAKLKIDWAFLKNQEANKTTAWFDEQIKKFEDMKIKYAHAKSAYDKIIKKIGEDKVEEQRRVAEELRRIEAQRGRQIQTWDQQQRGVIRYSLQWYYIQMERITAYLEWYPHNQDGYRTELENIQIQINRLSELQPFIDNLEQQWQNAQSVLNRNTLQWYRIEWTRYVCYANWYRPIDPNTDSPYVIRANEIESAIANFENTDDTDDLETDDEIHELDPMFNDRIEITSEEPIENPEQTYLQLKDKIATLRYKDILTDHIQRLVIGQIPQTQEQILIIKTAERKAFWHLVYDYIEKQNPLLTEEASEPKYLNILKVLKGNESIQHETGMIEINDEDWESLDSCLHDLAIKLKVKNTVTEITNNGPRRINRPIHDWFPKLMETKEGKSNNGKTFIRNRVKNLVDELEKFYNDEKDRQTPTYITEKLRSILEIDIIDNAQACSDAAIAGLELAESHVKFLKTTTLKETLDVFIQYYKLAVIRNDVVDLSQQESIEEYLYLVLKFNHYLNLGSLSKDMLYQQTGARKTFDFAFKKILDNIDYDRLLTYLSANELWQEKLMEFSPEYKNEQTSALEERENTLQTLDPNDNDYYSKTTQIDIEYNETLKELSRKISKELLDEHYVIQKSKYMGITAEHIHEIKAILDQ